MEISYLRRACGVTRRVRAIKACIKDVTLDFVQLELSVA